MFRKILFAALVTPLLGACATQSVASPSLPPEQAAVAQAACHRVMRLDPGIAQYDACVRSLSNTLTQAAGQGRFLAAAQRCDKAGLAHDRQAYAQCLLDRRDTAAATPSARHLDAAYVKPADSNPDSYFHSDNATKRHREEYACADLGLTPGGGAFASCVADLDWSLFNEDHPIN